MRKNAMHGGAPKLQKGDFSASFVKLGKDAGKYLIPIGIAALLLVVGVILQILAPSYLSDFTNEIANNYLSQTIDMKRLLDIGIILVVFYLVVAITTYGANFILTTATNLYAMKLRRDITEKINKVPLSYFDGHQHGDILSTLTNDVDQIGQSLQSSIGMVVQSLFMLIGVLIAMFCTSWQMALTALISLPFMILFVIIVTKFAMPQFKNRQDSLADVNSVVEESYNGQLIITCFNAKDKIRSAFEKENGKLQSAMFKAQCFGGLFQPLMSFISYFAYAAVYLVGGLLMDAKAGVTFGTITAFTVYVSLFQSPLSQLAQAMNTLQMAAASSKRVFDFLGQEELSSEEGKKFVFLGEDGKEHVKGEVEFRNVSFSYDDTREIIHDFSAKVLPGMKVAIVGPTGAGKTTMVNLLMRFYEVNGGDILIDGVSIKDMPRQEIHAIFGMVLQDTWMFEGTIRENLAYNTPNVTDEQIYDALHEASMRHYVRTLPGGLDYVLEDASTIAGGQKQLFTIARAMIKNAPLLILDEATSNVDTRTEEKIQEAMDKLTKGRTSFVIAHRLSTIKNADLILVMKDGNIIEQGTHDSLMAQNGFYASLYNSQFAFE